MEIYDTNLWVFFKEREFISSRTVTMTDRFGIFTKILAGLDHIQKNGFFHLDIKLSNVLIKTNSAGDWDTINVVITDFGIGGNYLSTLGKAGTPGFASPEQLIGQVHAKTDNFGFGRTLPFLFCQWNTAWNLLFQPITETEYNNLSAHLKVPESELLSIIRDLTHIDPNNRIDLETVKKRMNLEKTAFCTSTPIALSGVRIYNNVDERTQCSVLMQKEIEYISSFFTTRKRLNGPIITNKVHDQRWTNLCASFASTSALRGAQRRYLLTFHGKSLNNMRQEHDDVNGKFSFDKCLALLVGCVSPRSLDGIAANLVDSGDLYEAQLQKVGTNYFDRLGAQNLISETIHFFLWDKIARSHGKPFGLFYPLETYFSAEYFHP